MKKLFLYLLLLLFFSSLSNAKEFKPSGSVSDFSEVALSAEPIYIKCEFKSAMDENGANSFHNLRERLPYIKIIPGVGVDLNWDEREKQFNETSISFETHHSYYKFEVLLIRGDKSYENRFKIDRETGELGFLNIGGTVLVTYQCEKIEESDLPIVEIEQKF
jgi:hypothetical protein|tara:strand:- start:176 stop:661 length:486 start_codon:yes stop_codon:yes gene_type:complete